MRDYKNLNKLGINVSLSYVLCDKDFNKFDKFLEMFLENNLNNIVFLLYKPNVETNDKNYSESSIADLAELCEYAFKKLEKTNKNFNIEMSIPLCVLDKNILTRMISKKCITTCCHISKGMI